MNQNRHSCCCLDVRPCVLHLFLLCCFLTLWFVLCSLTNKRRRTRSETSFESCGHYVLKPLAFNIHANYASLNHVPYGATKLVRTQTRHCNNGKLRLRCFHRLDAYCDHKPCPCFTQPRFAPDNCPMCYDIY